MDERLIELYVQRGRLRERIGAQRGQMARELAPVGRALHTVDQARMLLEQARSWVSAHPAVTTAVVAAVFVWRPRAVFRSLRWGYVSWRNWTRLRQWFAG